jgi:hypothetical protein
MQRDFGDYVQLYLSKLMPSDEGSAIPALWRYAQRFVKQCSLPIGPVVIEGEYLDAQGEARFALALCARMRLFKIIKLWPSTIEIDIFQRLDTDDPEALIRIQFEMTLSAILWSRISFRDRDESLVEPFLGDLHLSMN